MIALKLRSGLARRIVDLVAAVGRYVTSADERVMCWCGRTHPSSFWHDPTHGRIDRDIQDRVTDVYGLDLPSGQRSAIEITLQERRDKGLSS